MAVKSNGYGATMSPRLKVPTKLPNRDAVFFTKDQLSVGADLVHFGRLAPRTYWAITRIESHNYTQGGVRRKENVATVRYLSDVIHLSRRDVTRGEVDHRKLTFSYLSYSAIWRVR